MLKWLRLWRTIRYFRPVQFYGRLWFRIYKPRPDTSSAPEIATAQLNFWVAPVPKPTSFSSPSQFTFLNQTHSLQNLTDWNHPEWDKLWLYNLHYFDYLNAVYSESADISIDSLIERWILENPLGYGNGWEPYPASLRIVNWIKWELQGNSLKPFWKYSLAIQVRYLSKRLEYHLLGNHLFENAKALVFAGLFFEGEEAESWLVKGVSLLSREIDEQILDDGGHFERSPMYHAIILDDILDLINLFNTYENRLPPQWSAVPEQCRNVAGKMLNWLAVMSHPDGDIALFNDSAFGIAPTLEELASYFQRLGLNSTSPTKKQLISLSSSGYLRYASGNAVVLMDVGAIGPDYLPGHAHADTLSFELSVFGQRIIVNSGTSCYGASSERLRQRGTAAHNTVTIDDENSSEVWGGFRVARRAHPKGLKIKNNPDDIVICCEHDGYQRLEGKPAHRREWFFEGKQLIVKDYVEGSGSHNAIAHFHIHPDLSLEYSAIPNSGWLYLPSGEKIIWNIVEGEVNVVDATYHPEFGVSLPNQCLNLKITGSYSEIIFNWS